MTDKERLNALRQSEMEEEHDELLSMVDDLQVISEPSVLEKRLDEVFNHLTEHFQNEESAGGLINAARKRGGALAALADDLAREHEDLVEAMDLVLMEDADGILRAIEGLARSLAEHEEKERHLAMALLAR